MYTDRRVVASCGLALSLIVSACAEHPRTATTTADTPPVASSPVAAVAPAKPVEIAPAPAATPTAPIPVEITHVPRKTRTQPVEGEVNPQAASVAEALRTHTHPERLSPMVKPKPFNAAAYAKDKKPYLDVTEPGRVFDTKQPTADTPILTPASATTASVDPGGTVRLAVQAIPGSPVSWLSTDLGSFENQLVSMTVEADANGIAEAHFTATPGVAGRVNIQAGSPLCSGQVRFVIDVNASPITPVAADANGKLQ